MHEMVHRAAHVANFTFQASVTIWSQQPRNPENPRVLSNSYLGQLKQSHGSSRNMSGFKALRGVCALTIIIVGQVGPTTLCLRRLSYRLPTVFSLDGELADDVGSEVSRGVYE